MEVFLEGVSLCGCRLVEELVQGLLLLVLGLASLDIFSALLEIILEVSNLLQSSFKELDLGGNGLEPDHLVSF